MSFCYSMTVLDIKLKFVWKREVAERGERGERERKGGEEGRETVGMGDERWQVRKEREQ